MTQWTDLEAGGTVWSDNETSGSALSASTGSSLVGFIQSGSDPSAQTVQGKARKVIHASDYTGYDATGASDSATAITNAIAAAVAAGITKVHINGTPICNSAIAISSGITLVGDGKYNTGITRNFSGSSNTDGLFNITGSANVTFEDMTLRSASGTSGGVVISVIADSSNSPSLNLKNVRVTTLGTDTHRYGVYVDGSAKATGALGVRTSTLINTEVFGGSQGAVYLKGCISFDWDGGGTFQSGGTSGKLEIDGDATVTSQNFNLKLSAVSELDLDYLEAAVMTIGTLGAITNTANVTRAFIIAAEQSGTIQTNWVQSWFFGPDGVRFPATQNASSNANTLDDYEEGSWTPALTFSTPGDLSVAYTDQIGRYQKVGNTVTLWFRILTSTFTHTTASGTLRVTGLPFTAANTSINCSGTCAFQGITKANYTQVNPKVNNNAASMDFAISGSGQNSGTVAFGDVPTGTTKFLEGTVTYQAAS